MTLIDKYQGLRNHLSLIEEDVNRAATGNKAAGTRVRKAMQEAKKMAQEIRNAVTELKQAK